MELQALRKHGWSNRALARESGLSRNTVRRELRSARGNIRLHEPDVQPRLRRWGHFFNEPVVATAIVDRLLHNATVLNIRGHSYCVRGYHADLRDDRLAGDIKAAKGHL